MYTGHIGFIARMLSLQHGGPAQLMSPVGKLNIIIILFHGFGRVTLVPGEDEVGYSLHYFLVKVIFHMTLGADQRTHLLVGSIRNVYPFSFKGLCQCRP